MSILDEGESRPVVPGLSEWVPNAKPSHDLGDGKRIFDYKYDSSSGSTMEYTGRYEGHVKPEDIIQALGDGTFGHRGPKMYGGHFTYTKITDRSGRMRRRSEP